MSPSVDDATAQLMASRKAMLLLGQPDEMYVRRCVEVIGSGMSDEDIAACVSGLDAAEKHAERTHLHKSVGPHRVLRPRHVWVQRCVRFFLLSARRLYPDMDDMQWRNVVDLAGKLTQAMLENDRPVGERRPHPRARAMAEFTVMVAEQFPHLQTEGQVYRATALFALATGSEELPQRKPDETDERYQARSFHGVAQRVRTRLTDPAGRYAIDYDELKERLHHNQKQAAR